MTSPLPPGPEDGRWLAASHTPPPGARVLDVGCGNGLILACLHTRVPGLNVHGLEVDPTAAAQARTHLPHAHIYTARVEDWVPPQRFDAIYCNPPFHTRGSAAVGRKGAAHHTGPNELTTWLKKLASWLAPGGTLALVLHTQQAPQLPQLAQQLGLTGSTTPLATHPTRPPKRILVHLGFGHAPLTTNPPIPAYTPALRTAVLARLEALPR